MIEKPSELASFGDFRLTERFKMIVSAIQKEPQSSFPRIFSNKAQLEAFYRFMNNERVNSSEIIRASCDETKKKLRKSEPVIAIHDTTLFDFKDSTAIEGLGRTTSKHRKGFFGHFCLASTLDREILGILGLTTWTRLH